MSIITLAVARRHLRVEDDYPAEQIQGKLDAAEDHAAQYLNRRLFASAGDLQAAVDAVPADLAAARTAYDAATTAAANIEDPELQALARGRAEIAYVRAKTLAQETFDGIVLTPSIEAAVLLILGLLFQNREDGQAGTMTSLPLGSRQLLTPYRVQLGV
ncbi:head-tail connector protein [uncultured Pseudacidovorax sp.]|uniref:head-tail connector protein n=1 Tax=uncultured Pseudacidovorax sp. TaxID=679313 RepID=UPI0025E696E2|nr:head-tail connector protein [uncultured Pseudacidovorax sp.]